MTSKVALLILILVRLLQDGRSAPFHAAADDEGNHILADAIEKLSKYIDYKVKSSIKATLKRVQEDSSYENKDTTSKFDGFDADGRKEAPTEESRSEVTRTFSPSTGQDGSGYKNGGSPPKTTEKDDLQSEEEYLSTSTEFDPSDLLVWEKTIVFDSTWKNEDPRQKVTTSISTVLFAEKDGNGEAFSTTALSPSTSTELDSNDWKEIGKDKINHQSETFLVSDDPNVAFAEKDENGEAFSTTALSPSTSTELDSNDWKEVSEDKINHESETSLVKDDPKVSFAWEDGDGEIYSTNILTPFTSTEIDSNEWKKEDNILTTAFHSTTTWRNENPTWMTSADEDQSKSSLANVTLARNDFSKEASLTIISTLRKKSEIAEEHLELTSAMTDPAWKDEVSSSALVSLRSKSPNLERAQSESTTPWSGGNSGEGTSTAKILEQDSDSKRESSREEFDPRDLLMWDGQKMEGIETILASSSSPTITESSGVTLKPWLTSSREEVFSTTNSAAHAILGGNGASLSSETSPQTTSFVYEEEDWSVGSITTEDDHSNGSEVTPPTSFETCKSATLNFVKTLQSLYKDKTCNAGKANEDCKCDLLIPIGKRENKIYLAENPETPDVQKLYVPIAKISKKDKSFQFTDYMKKLFV